MISILLLIESKLITISDINQQLNFYFVNLNKSFLMMIYATIVEHNYLFLVEFAEISIFNNHLQIQNQNVCFQTFAVSFPVNLEKDAKIR